MRICLIWLVHAGGTLLEGKTTQSAWIDNNNTDVICLLMWTEYNCFWSFLYSVWTTFGCSKTNATGLPLWIASWCFKTKIYIYRIASTTQSLTTPQSYPSPFVYSVIVCVRIALHSALAKHLEGWRTHCRLTFKRFPRLQTTTAANENLILLFIRRVLFETCMFVCYLNVSLMQMCGSLTNLRIRNIYTYIHIYEEAKKRCEDICAPRKRDICIVHI